MKRTALGEHINAILYLEGTTGYTTAYFTDRKTKLYAYPLIRFAEVMPTLIRTHRTYLVNPDHVAAFHHQGVAEAFVVVGGKRNYPSVDDESKPSTRPCIPSVR